LGLDIWVAAQTSIHCALAGKIHSFQNNANSGDYGPTIIMEHEMENHRFYTLYGHLSTKSLDNIAIGQYFEKGAVIAYLGNASENGNYAPHVHFQIIQNLENHFGDYPGVCHRNDLGLFSKNCPDPNLILKLAL
jgi:murein DD-endopeptidase MepM/ murein hydrolase activator NlpD